MLILRNKVSSYFVHSIGTKIGPRHGIAAGFSIKLNHTKVTSFMCGAIIISFDGNSFCFLWYCENPTYNGVKAGPFGFLWLGMHHSLHIIKFSSCLLQLEAVKCFSSFIGFTTFINVSLTIKFTNINFSTFPWLSNLAHTYWCFLD